MIAYFGYIGIQQHVHISNIEQNRSMVDLKIVESQKLNEALKAEKDKLQQAAYIEKVAREELGLVKPGEVPYISSQ